MNVNKDLFATYDNKSFLTRITTRNTITVFEDIFTITLRDKCHDVSIVGAGLTVKALDDSIKTADDPFNWHMWQFAEAKFAPLVLSSTPQACPTYYYLTDTDINRTVMPVSIMKIDETDSATYYIDSTFWEEQKRFYLVRAVVWNVNQNKVVLISEDKYHVSVTNPCKRTDEVVSQALPDTIYWVKDSVTTVSFNPFDDKSTVDYGNDSRTPTE